MAHIKNLLIIFLNECNICVWISASRAIPSMVGDFIFRMPLPLCHVAFFLSHRWLRLAARVRDLRQDRGPVRRPSSSSCRHFSFASVSIPVCNNMYIWICIICICLCSPFLCNLIFKDFQGGCLFWELNWGKIKDWTTVVAIFHNVVWSQAGKKRMNIIQLKYQRNAMENRNSKITVK